MPIVWIRDSSVGFQISPHCTRRFSNQSDGSPNKKITKTKCRLTKIKRNEVYLPVECGLIDYITMNIDHDNEIKKRERERDRKIMNWSKRIVRGKGKESEPRACGGREIRKLRWFSWRFRWLLDPGGPLLRIVSGIGRGKKRFSVDGGRKMRYDIYIYILVNM